VTGDERLNLIGPARRRLWEGGPLPDTVHLRALAPSGGEFADAQDRADALALGREVCRLRVLVDQTERERDMVAVTAKLESANELLDDNARLRDRLEAAERVCAVASELVSSAHGNLQLVTALNAWDDARS